MVTKALALNSEATVAKAFWILTFAVLTAIGAQIEIPRQPVPFTLQTFFVLLAGGMLGARKGSLSMVLYLTMGAVGLPVFSSAGFGIGRILGMTGGYLLAFPLAALLVGLVLSYKGKSLAWVLAALVLGLSVIFALGTVQLKLVTGMSWSEAYSGGFLIFSWWDLLKLSAAAAIIRAAGPEGQRPA